MIETKRLILRRIQIEDAKDIFEYSSDLENTKYVDFITHKSLDETKEIITKIFIDDFEGKYGIVLKENNKLIGIIEARLKENLVDLGWIINKNYWNKGYCTEAAKEIIELYRQKFNINIFTASFKEGNESSRKVMEKLGFTYKNESFNKNNIKVKNYILV
ncbi:GNAT family N-acetyltransferase [Spiroplasma diminutum]|uniref:Acetyltransferase, GNAT family n=1 Tax=Spiroplasma diminutum CUAS-1 TaxID=1276221 RepID=S5MJR6_9MOLU|nr:GNAT family N-acetyltransferase [Spiroplasma diminutum]AGR42195.1 acetyltransferase, GNAT family [Spiroplasma diminutum CUAS-1]